MAFKLPILPKDGFETLFATEMGTPDGLVETARKNSSLYDTQLAMSHEPTILYRHLL
jgi:hypothetical protein